MSEATNIKVTYNNQPLHPTEQKIEVGSPVKSKRTGEYLGKVKELRIITVAEVQYDDKYRHTYPYEVADLELAPQLTPEEAWAEVPILVLRVLTTPGSGTTFYSDEYSALRFHCYKLLGGAGVKVTDEVKARVRKIVQDVCQALYIDIAE
jgi:hypothetical protein